MKKSIKLLLTIPVLSGVLFMSCNSDSDKTASSTTTTDSSSMMKKDTGMSTMATDTSTMKSGMKKKGKASAMMMAAADKGAPMSTDKTGYYSSVETLPTYPGGQAALDQFFADNVEYPSAATDKGTEGTVIVHFGIDENGKVTNATTTGTALGNGLEAEALRVINKMPAWTPGMVKGKKVKAYYSLPIRFQLAE